MLYNVLPPLIFFASLGGIIFVISRVVLRVHRREHIETIRRAAKDPAARLHKASTIAALIGPTHKSVQSVRHRLTLLRHLLRTPSASIKSWFTAVGRGRTTPQRIHLRLRTKSNQPATDQLSQTPPSVSRPTGAEAPRTGSLTFPKHGQAKAGPAAPEASLSQNMAKRRQAPPHWSRLLQARRHITHLIKRAVKTTADKTKERLRRWQPTAMKNASSQATTNQITAVSSTEAETSLAKLSPAAARPILRLSIAQPARRNDAARHRPSPHPTHRRPPQNRSTIKGSHPRTTSGSLLDQARRALANKQLTKAEHLLVPHLAKHPRDIDAYMLLGRAAAGQGHWDEAAEIYEQVIKINPTVVGSHAALGRARYEVGQFTKAIEALRRAHDEDPRDISVIEYLLKIARRMDNVPMQRALTEELAELESNL